MLAFKMWSPILRGYNILFFVDNESVVHVLNKKTSNDPDMMVLLRKMVLISMNTGIEFSAKHIKGSHNLVVDALSRLNLQKARELAPWLDQEPTNIPLEWLPWSTSQET